MATPAPAAPMPDSSGSGALIFAVLFVVIVLVGLLVWFLIARSHDDSHKHGDEGDESNEGNEGEDSDADSDDSDDSDYSDFSRAKRRPASKSPPATQPPPAPQPAPAPQPSPAPQPAPSPPPAPPTKTTLQIQVPGNTYVPVVTSGVSGPNPRTPDVQAERDAYIGSLVRRIMAAQEKDRLKVTADVLAEILRSEESNTLYSALLSNSDRSPELTNASRDDRRLQAAYIAEMLLRADYGGMRNILHDQSDEALDILYDAVVTSLENSNVVSDTTRRLLSNIKVLKCQQKFKSDPAGLVQCMAGTALLTSSAPVTTAPAPAVPAPIAPVTTAVTAPATAPVTTTTATAPAPATAPVTVSSDGLVKVVDGTSLAFSFDADKLQVCDGPSCKKTVLV